MILERIAEATRNRVQKEKEKITLEELISTVYRNGKLQSFHERPSLAFQTALRREGMSFICEVKKASPSKGVIAEEFPFEQIAKEYELAGADCISVLTEPDFFLGSNEYLSLISRKSGIPILRKDFIVDEYQLYEAKVIGADAVLLICTLLEETRLKSYLDICRNLGLSALVEAHTEEEVRRAVRCGAELIGVNNRNLTTFEVDLMTSIRLRKLVPEDVIFIAESGIKTPEDIRLLREAGTNAVLIGESLMRSNNKKQMLEQLRDNGSA